MIKPAKLILDIKNAGKPVAAVCHGSAAFLASIKKDSSFLQGKEVSCFSNTEEKLVGKTGHIPYLLEDALKKAGAKIDNATIPFTSNTKVDGNLITGQKPFICRAYSQKNDRSAERRSIINWPYQETGNIKIVLPVFYFEQRKDQ